MRLEIGGYVGARERCMLSVRVVCLCTIFLFSSTFFFFFFLNILAWNSTVGIGEIETGMGTFLV
jgi:hypothetical protein